ncbi:MAG: plasmid stabilization protein [Vulcanimicrobiota bacterium]
MANLIIRNLPDNVHQALRQRAAQSGRSMEAEARAILAQACIVETDPLEEFQRWTDEVFAAGKPDSGVDELIAERRAEAAKEP